MIDNFAEEEIEEILTRLKKVFGIHTFSVAYETDADMESIFSVAKLVCKNEGTFKVASHRGDKRFPLTSVEISKELGGRLLSVFHNLKVDVHTPSFTVNVDIREGGKALVFSEFIFHSFFLSNLLYDLL